MLKVLALKLFLILCYASEYVTPARKAKVRMYKITTDAKGSRCIIAHERIEEYQGRQVTLRRSIAIICKTTGVNGEYLDWERAAKVICDALNAAEQEGKVDGELHTKKEAMLFGEAAG
jgi:hypothetical protein